MGAFATAEFHGRIFILCAPQIEIKRAWEFDPFRFAGTKCCPPQKQAAATKPEPNGARVS
jgi:hypothetical protein